MRVGLLFHKDPLQPAAGVDLIRLRALAEGLRRQGADASVVAPVDREARLGSISVEPLGALAEPGRFDVVKACYHFSLELLGEYDGPVVCRLVRVVDELLPQRDEPCRKRLLACQDIARERARGVVCNNRLNARRWRERYGSRQQLAIIPTGCPAQLPPLGPDPYGPGPPPMLFLGSVAAPRMVDLLNAAADRLRGEARIHHVGRNKTGLYGGAGTLSPLIVQHGEAPEDQTWDFARWARLGLALAAGPDAFDNDLSKVVAYVRAGLPVLGEERLANAGLFLRRGFGAEFRYGDAAHLAQQTRRLLAASFEGQSPGVMAWAARGHSWDRRAAALTRFLLRLTGR